MQPTNEARSISIPVWLVGSFGVYLLASLFGGIWWAATVRADVNYLASHVQSLEKQYSENTRGNYDMGMAAVDKAAYESRFATMDRRITSLETDLREISLDIKSLVSDMAAVKAAVLRPAKDLN